MYSFSYQERQQQLQCYPNAGEFGGCPQQRTDPSNFSLRCELQQNTRRCQMQEQRVSYDVDILLSTQLRVLTGVVQKVLPPPESKLYHRYRIKDVDILLSTQLHVLTVY